MDVFQLAAYGLIAAIDGLEVDELALVAQSHPEEGRHCRELLGEHWFRGLAAPRIRLLTWEEVGKVED